MTWSFFKGYDGYFSTYVFRISSGLTKQQQNSLPNILVIISIPCLNTSKKITLTIVIIIELHTTHIDELKSKFYLRYSILACFEPKRFHKISTLLSKGSLKPARVHLVIDLFKKENVVCSLQMLVIFATSGINFTFFHNPLLKEARKQ